MIRPALLLCLSLLATARAEAPPTPANAKPLFDGKTLAQWEGNPKWWRVEDGVISGGSLTETVPHNDFLATVDSFGDFDLRFEIRITGAGGFINSGVQVRSQRAAQGTEMVGYQVDAGDGWWGKLYDESRRNRVIAEAADLKAVNASIVKDGWNAYVIRGEGPRLRSWVNGVPALDYTEADPAIPLDGRIGIQVHGGGKALVQVRNVTIARLEAGPRFLGAPEPGKAAKPSPLPADEQRATFTVPPDFDIELVAAESEGLGKFITVEWDTRGRMWTMTALEYPVDGNENKERADALYANPAKDKVLVFDQWAGPGPHTPRVFAEGLAIPLGILPLRNGVYVQHGHDIAFLSDTNADGKADKRDVILSGFGVQDSHLFPHQFTRAPGNWLWLAQGAFNYGTVKTSKGAEIKFDQTRMAKFRADGAEFDITSNGPCNIWGLVLTDEGEAWIQEANDFGYPVMPFHEYGNYPGCSDGQWKSYSPEYPGTAPHFKMGGTGLSGLALTDRTLWPAPYNDVMTVANPIIRKVQSIRIHREGAQVRLEKLPDLVQSSDEWFRPVAIRMGPDGCLYVVDWYNKIISHNEVPRNHPDRDKIRGRVWRVKPKGFTPLPVPDFMALPEAELLARLGSPSQTANHLAWQAIVDRGLVTQVPALRAIALDGAQPPHRRIPALWAIEGLQSLDADLLRHLAGDPDRNVRREAVRAYNEYASLAAADRIAAVAGLVNDPDPAVRAEVIKLAGRLAGAEPSALALAVASIREALAEPLMPSTRNGKPIPTREAYDRAYERYLARLFLERVPGPLSAFLASPAGQALPVESQLWASLALEPAASASRVAKLLPQLKRPPNKEEVLRLVDRVNEPEAGEAIRAALENPATRDAVLAALLEVKTRIDPTKAGPLLGGIVRDLLKGDDAAVGKGLELAGGFRMADLEPQLLAILDANPAPAPARVSAVLRALAEIGGGKSPRVLALAGDPRAEPGLRNEAVAVIASVKNGGGAKDILGIWKTLTPSLRRTALDRLTTSKGGAQQIVPAIRDGTIAKDDLDGTVVERLQTHLVGRADLDDLMRELGDFFKPVLGLNGQEDAWLDAGITLDGPFTVETWIRLENGIGNQDGILGAPGQLDINFFDSRFRVYLFPPVGDIITAKKPMSADLWVHLAVVRDDNAVFHLYQNGELDSSSGKADPRKLENLRIGWTSTNGGTHGALNEYRVWNRARTAAEIRANFDRSLAGQEKPAGLVFLATGAEGWPKPNKGAAVVRTNDLPPLLTAGQSRALDEKFAKYEALGHKPGDAAKGKQTAALCMACHLIGDQGNSIGPNLSGVGAMGLEAILRNILTPNAAMEPGYRIFRAELRNGEIREGFLASEDKDAVVIRMVGAQDLRVARADIVRTSFLRRSLMPEGLLDAMPAEQVTDLLTYLQSLK